LDRKATEDNKVAYYSAKLRSDWLSATLGPNSPAKAAAKKRKIKAAYKAALNELTRELKEAKDLQDVLAQIDKATKGSSTLPALLAETTTTEDMAAVLEIVKDDKDMAKLLAAKLLNATNET
jgi:predicted metalloendopeptidase